MSYRRAAHQKDSETYIDLQKLFDEANPKLASSSVKIFEYTYGEKFRKIKTIWRYTIIGVISIMFFSIANHFYPGDRWSFFTFFVWLLLTAGFIGEWMVLK